MDTNQGVEELVICRLKQPLTTSELLTALKPTTDWLRAQPGFLWRQSGLSDDGRLVDRCGWATLEQAQEAARRFPEAPESQTLEAVLDPEGMVFVHYRPLGKG